MAKGRLCGVSIVIIIIVIIFTDYAMLGLFRPPEGYVGPSILNVGAMSRLIGLYVTIVFAILTSSIRRTCFHCDLEFRILLFS
jgi:hypothetical protein